jgi:hypothetical protein
MNTFPKTLTAHSHATRHTRPASFRPVISAAALLLAACAAPALALPPNIADRSYVQLPYYHYGFVIDGTPDPAERRYVETAGIAVSSEFALLGSNMTLRAIYDCCLPGTIKAIEEVTLTAHPVIVTEPPWADGTSFSTHKTIAPPVNPLGTETFGAALAIHGNRVAVSSPEVLMPYYYLCCGDDWWGPELIVANSRMASGRVHLYQYNGTSFTPERTIVHGGLDDLFGAAIAMDATHLLVGRPGAPELFGPPGAADLFDPGTGSLVTTFSSPSAFDGFGRTLALAGDLAIVGAADQAIVYVYRHDGAGTWSPAGELTSPGAGSEFGASIAADGERILIGAPDIDRAYVFEDDGDSDWPVVAELSGGAGSRFGAAVALTGDSAFIGAPWFTYGPLIRVGLVVRHDRADDGTWPFVESKNSRQPVSNSQFGSKVAASQSMLAAVEQDQKSLFYPAEMSVFTGPSPGC